MILEVRELRKYYAPARPGWRRLADGRPDVVRAVDGVSFTLAKAESLGLVGESGSGKTTLARCILRLEEPTSGEILVGGRDFLRLSGAELRRQRRRLQAVFQDPHSSLNPKMRVSKIVGEPLLIHQVGDREERRAAVGRLLREVGLDPDSGRHFPHEFSGGQKQRIAIARALALRPEILVADEPVSSLDVSVQAQILELLGRLRDRHGLSLIFISHSLPVVRMICDRIAVMYRGRIVEMAPAPALFENPRHPYSRMLIESVPVADPSRRSTPPKPARTIPRGTLSEVAPGHWTEVIP